MSKTISVREASRLLGIGLNYAYHLVWTGKLAAEKVDGRWQIPMQAVSERQRLGS